LALQNLIQPTISLEMPVPSQGHYGFHSFPVVDITFFSKINKSTHLPHQKTVIVYYHVNARFTWLNGGIEYFFCYLM
jgi:hypothetical protein